ncbi:hypothetical protein D9757_008086 [Collybiopsis confluens]|uniref:Uncharacterized protein n=1 Tax=Collybiopsis confluens TaxID=2823264 RepID=A0A8H5H6P7_9AGAR|nr:hypothetical protein D9757_008086 [Collybiopsis confluens]
MSRPGTTNHLSRSLSFAMQKSSQCHPPRHFYHTHEYAQAHGPSGSQSFARNIPHYAGQIEGDGKENYRGHSRQVSPFRAMFNPGNAHSEANEIANRGFPIQNTNLSAPTQRFTLQTHCGGPPLQMDESDYCARALQTPYLPAQFIAATPFPYRSNTHHDRKNNFGEFNSVDLPQHGVPFSSGEPSVSGVLHAKRTGFSSGCSVSAGQHEVLSNIGQTRRADGSHDTISTTSAAWDASDQLSYGFTGQFGVPIPTQAQIPAMIRRDMVSHERRCPISISYQNEASFQHIAGHSQSNNSSTITGRGGANARSRPQSLNERAPVVVPSRNALSSQVVLEDTLKSSQDPRLTSSIVDIFLRSPDKKNPITFLSSRMESAGPNSELESELRRGLPTTVSPLFGSDVMSSVLVCNEWVNRQENHRDAMVHLCRLVLSAVCREPMSFSVDKIVHYRNLISNMILMFKHSQPVHVEIFKRMMVATAEYLFTRLFEMWLDLASKKTWKPISDYGLIHYGIIQARILGMLFEMGLMTFSRWMSLAWFLYEHPPHQYRLYAMLSLIASPAGGVILRHTELRELGDFLAAVGRKYVVPPLGGIFPDVFFADFPSAGEEERRAVFEGVRERVKVGFLYLNASTINADMSPAITENDLFVEDEK